MSKVEKLEESEGGVTLVSTTAYNRLVDAINALIDMKVVPQGVGKLEVGDKNSVLDLNPLRQQVVQWVQEIINGGAGGGSSGGGGSGGGSDGTPPDGSPGGGGGLPPEWEKRLNNFSVKAVCNGDGTITISGSL